MYLCVSFEQWVMNHIVHVLLMSAFSREKKNMTLLIIDFMSYMKRLSLHVSNNQYGALINVTLDGTLHGLSVLEFGRWMLYSCGYWFISPASATWLYIKPAWLLLFFIICRVVHGVKEFGEASQILKCRYWVMF